jgi:hypothetical protein
MFTNIKNALIAENNKNKENALNRLKEVNDLNEAKAIYKKRLTTIQAKKCVSLEILREIISDKIEKNYQKTIQKELNELTEIENAPDLKYINISVEWKPSKTWGKNPRAEARDGVGRYDSGSVGGCGYDKQSTAVANAVNQSKSLLKELYKVRETDVNTHLHLLFGYGAGYGILPRIEGGVGVSCYPDIFKKIGFDFKTIASGKTFDAYSLTKIN